ncbi:MAG TPA: ABC transporter substrate-binding protein [Stellaceae bacterium]|jgi:putative ABC transport system substrate-binding protein|nr:ABC transporter substrate-binding protein [Stellaceae bacterium]
MRRRELLPLLGLAALSSLPCGALSAEKMWRVGYLDGGAGQVRSPLFERFRQRLLDLGYREGRNIVYEARFAEGDRTALPALVRELIAWRPDALLVATTPANLTAKAATSTIPIVMIAGADPVDVGLVDSLSRPGGNITGVTSVAADLTEKRIDILKELVPGAARFAVLYKPEDPSTPEQLRNGRSAAARLGVELGPLLRVAGPEAFDTLFSAAIQGGAGAAIRFFDPLAISYAAEIAAAAAKYRLPVIYPWRQNVEAGGLVGYGTSLDAQYVQAAGLMDKILKGARPADIPVQQPTKYELAINLKTAKALGLTVPSFLLAQAVEVIE